MAGSVKYSEEEIHRMAIEIACSADLSFTEFSMGEEEYSSKTLPPYSPKWKGLPAGGFRTKTDAKTALSETKALKEKKSVNVPPVDVRLYQEKTASEKLKLSRSSKEQDTASRYRKGQLASINIEQKFEAGHRRGNKGTGIKPHQTLKKCSVALQRLPPHLCEQIRTKKTPKIVVVQPDPVKVNVSDDGGNASPPDNLVVDYPIDSEHLFSPDLDFLTLTLDSGTSGQAVTVEFVNESADSSISCLQREAYTYFMSSDDAIKCMVEAADVSSEHLYLKGDDAMWNDVTTEMTGQSVTSTEFIHPHTMKKPLSGDQTPEVTTPVKSRTPVDHEDLDRTMLTDFPLDQQEPSSTLFQSEVSSTTELQDPKVDTSMMPSENTVIVEIDESVINLKGMGFVEDVINHLQNTPIADFQPETSLSQDKQTAASYVPDLLPGQQPIEPDSLMETETPTILNGQETKSDPSKDVSQTQSEDISHTPNTDEQGNVSSANVNETQCESGVNLMESEENEKSAQSKGENEEAKQNFTGDVVNESEDKNDEISITSTVQTEATIKETEVACEEIAENSICENSSLPSNDPEKETSSETNEKILVSVGTTSAAEHEGPDGEKTLHSETVASPEKALKSGQEFVSEEKPDKASGGGVTDDSKSRNRRTKLWKSKRKGQTSQTNKSAEPSSALTVDKGKHSEDLNASLSSESNNTEVSGPQTDTAVCNPAQAKSSVGEKRSTSKSKKSSSSSKTKTNKSQLKQPKGTKKISNKDRSSPKTKVQAASVPNKPRSCYKGKGTYIPMDIYKKKFCSFASVQRHIETPQSDPIKKTFPHAVEKPVVKLDSVPKGSSQSCLPFKKRDLTEKNKNLATPETLSPESVTDKSTLSFENSSQICPVKSKPFDTPQKSVFPTTLPAADESLEVVHVVSQALSSSPPSLAVSKSMMKGTSPKKSLWSVSLLPPKAPGVGSDSYSSPKLKKKSFPSKPLEVAIPTEESLPQWPKSPDKTELHIKPVSTKSSKPSDSVFSTKFPKSPTSPWPVSMPEYMHVSPTKSPPKSEHSDVTSANSECRYEVKMTEQSKPESSGGKKSRPIASHTTGKGKWCSQSRGGNEEPFEDSPGKLKSSDSSASTDFTLKTPQQNKPVLSDSGHVDGKRPLAAAELDSEILVTSSKSSCRKRKNFKPVRRALDCRPNMPVKENLKPNEDLFDIPDQPLDIQPLIDKIVGKIISDESVLSLDEISKVQPGFEGSQTLVLETPSSSHSNNVFEINFSLPHGALTDSSVINEEPASVKGQRFSPASAHYSQSSSSSEENVRDLLRQLIAGPCNPSVALVHCDAILVNGVCKEVSKAEALYHVKHLRHGKDSKLSGTTCKAGFSQDHQNNKVLDPLLKVQGHSAHDVPVDERMSVPSMLASENPDNLSHSVQSPDSSSEQIAILSEENLHVSPQSLDRQGVGSMFNQNDKTKRKRGRPSKKKTNYGMKTKTKQDSKTNEKTSEVEGNEPSQSSYTSPVQPESMVNITTTQDSTDACIDTSGPAPVTAQTELSHVYDSPHSPEKIDGGQQAVSSKSPCAERNSTDSLSLVQNVVASAETNQTRTLSEPDKLIKSSHHSLNENTYHNEPDEGEGSGEKESEEVNTTNSSEGSAALQHQSVEPQTRTSRSKSRDCKTTKRRSGSSSRITAVGSESAKDAVSNNPEQLESELLQNCFTDSRTRLGRSISPKPIKRSRRSRSLSRTSLEDNTSNSLGEPETLNLEYLLNLQPEYPEWKSQPSGSKLPGPEKGTRRSRSLTRNAAKNVESVTDENFEQFKPKRRSKSPGLERGTRRSRSVTRNSAKNGVKDITGENSEQFNPKHHSKSPGSERRTRRGRSVTRNGVKGDVEDVTDKNSEQFKPKHCSKSPGPERGTRQSRSVTRNAAKDHVEDVTDENSEQFKPKHRSKSPGPERGTRQSRSVTRNAAKDIVEDVTDENSEQFKPKHRSKSPGPERGTRRSRSVTRNAAKDIVEDVTDENSEQFKPKHRSKLPGPERGTRRSRSVTRNAAKGLVEDVTDENSEQLNAKRRSKSPGPERGTRRSRSVTRNADKKSNVVMDENHQKLEPKQDDSPDQVTGSGQSKSNRATRRSRSRTRKAAKRPAETRSCSPRPTPLNQNPHPEQEILPRQSRSLETTSKQRPKRSRSLTRLIVDNEKLRSETAILISASPYPQFKCLRSKFSTSNRSDEHVSPQSRVSQKLTQHPGISSSGDILSGNGLAIENGVSANVVKTATTTRKKNDKSRGRECYKRKKSEWVDEMVLSPKVLKTSISENVTSEASSVEIPSRLEIMPDGDQIDLTPVGQSSYTVCSVRKRRFSEPTLGERNLIGDNFTETPKINKYGSSVKLKAKGSVPATSSSTRKKRKQSSSKVTAAILTLEPDTSIICPDPYDFVQNEESNIPTLVSVDKDYFEIPDDSADHEMPKLSPAEPHPRASPYKVHTKSTPKAKKSISPAKMSNQKSGNQLSNKRTPRKRTKSESSERSLPIYDTDLNLLQEELDRNFMAALNLSFNEKPQQQVFGPGQVRNKNSRVLSTLNGPPELSTRVQFDDVLLEMQEFSQDPGSRSFFTKCSDSMHIQIILSICDPCKLMTKLHPFNQITISKTRQSRPLTTVEALELRKKFT